MWGQERRYANVMCRDMSMQPSRLNPLGDGGCGWSWACAAAGRR